MALEWEALDDLAGLRVQFRGLVPVGDPDKTIGRESEVPEAARIDAGRRLDGDLGELLSFRIKLQELLRPVF